jgi:hypothetical protein
MDVAESSWLRRMTLVGILAVACVATPDHAVGSPDKANVRLISATESRIVFEVDLSTYTIRPSVHLQGTETLEISGFGKTSEPGKPSVPMRRFLVGLPPRGEPSLSWRVDRSQPLGSRRLEPGPYAFVREDDDGKPVVGEEYRIDQGVYEQTRSAIDVTAEPVARIRHQRVLPVYIAPVRYDPSTGETMLATLIHVEVLLGSGAPNRPGSEEPQVPVRESPVWEQVFGRILVNPEQAAGWRTRSSTRPRDMSESARVSEALSGPLVKLLVRDTGLHRVSASTVIGKGFPGGALVNDLRVFKRGYDPVSLSETVTDLPYRVVEDPAGKPGEFDGADQVVFYGQRLREDGSQEDPLEKFSAANVYWLGSSGGTPMVAVPIEPGVVSADTATASFPVSDHYEEDRVFNDPTPPGEKEFYYYNKPNETSFSTIFNATSIDPTQTFQLKARFLGGYHSSVDRILKLSIRNSHGTTPLNDVLVNDKNVVSYTSQVLPANLIDDGGNTFQIDQPPPTSQRTTLEALLDWFTIEYRARYHARGNTLEFNSASLVGDTSITVTGLGGTDVRLFDVTDPLAPREYTLTPAHFTNTGNGYAVSFRQTYSSRKDFILTPLSAIHEIPSADVVTDNPSGLIGGPAENGVDVLVVSHASFLGEMGRWVDLRKAQGYGVLMTDVQDVFDEFSGGVPTARGIKKFIRHFVETGGASFVVLVGDASEDNKHVSAEAGENFVPTESYSEYAGGGFNQDEVVTTDNWYAMLDSDFINENPVLVSDFFPEVMIGRLPFGSVSEARDVVGKILKFEAPSAEDFWRRRMIRVADNAFSGAPLCYHADEENFQRAEESAAQTAENAIPGGFDIVRFYLAEKLANVEPPHQSGSCDRTSTLASTTRYGGVTSALLGELNAGASLVSFQAHMNRSQICHEALFETSMIWGVRDHLQLSNTERPWIVFGMGCHMSDYAIWDEHAWYYLESNEPNGDALSELMLLQKAGAVSTYGSSGFEYLTPNVSFTAALINAFFDDVPTDTMVASNKAQARWILGELMTVAEIQNLVLNSRGGGGDGSVGQTKRYHLLGDPVLRIDGGPPRFDVTVNGVPFTSGENVASVAGNGVVDVRAIITDEAAIDSVSLEIAGEDSSRILTKTALNDEDLTAARKYEVRFRHRLEAKAYDIVLKAYQAADTTAGRYLIAAQFVFKVAASAGLTVNGRPVVDGDNVPPVGEYLFKVELPVFVDGSLIRVERDGEPVSALEKTHPSPEDSITWLVRFTQELTAGPHQIVLFVGAAQFAYTVVVGTQAGVLDLIAYPNPFTDEVYFVFRNEVAIASGSVDVFTVSGKKVAHIDIPLHARSPGQNTVRWDGRTFDGAEIANGTYLFVVSVDQAGQKTTERGKLVRMK